MAVGSRGRDIVRPGRQHMKGCYTLQLANQCTSTIWRINNTHVVELFIDCLFTPFNSQSINFAECLDPMCYMQKSSWLVNDSPCTTDLTSAHLTIRHSHCTIPIQLGLSLTVGWYLVFSWLVGWCGLVSRLVELVRLFLVVALSFDTKFLFSLRKIISNTL